MNKFRLSALCFACFTMGTASATDLIDVYNQSLKSDPTFKEAEANWLAAKTALPLARSYIFPHVDLTAHADRAFGRQTIHGINISEGWNSQTGYGISVSQPVFNYAAWAGISEASASVKSATAMYLASSQELMTRVANAYFEVLRANQTLKYTLAEKNTLYQTLQQQLQEYRVGLIAITGVYNAQSQYDSIVALEIANRNTLSDRLEDLRAITGVYYPELAGLRNNVPLATPEPSNINAWVNIAGQHNYGILAQKYAVVASREDIKVQAANSYPTIGLTSTYLDTNTKGGSQPGENRSFQAAAAVDFPIFQGGQTLANTDKARYNFLNSSATLEQTYRDTLNNTRQSYLNVSSLIYKISADLQSIKSKQNNLAATRAGYKVGTRTMVDVLMAIQELTAAQKDFANDQYDYVLSTIALKADAGTLSVADLQKINQWLNQPLVFDTKIRSSLKPVNVNPNANTATMTAKKVHHNQSKPYQTANPVVHLNPPPRRPTTAQKLPTRTDSQQSMQKIDKNVAKQPHIELPKPKLGKPVVAQETTTTTTTKTATLSEPFDSKPTPMPVEVVNGKTTTTHSQVTLPKPLATTPNTTKPVEAVAKDDSSQGRISTSADIPPAVSTKQVTAIQSKVQPSQPKLHYAPKVTSNASTAADQSTDSTAASDTSEDNKPADSTQSSQPTTAPGSQDLLTDPNASAKAPLQTVAHNHYTIQLYASPQMSKVQAFMREHKLQNLTLASTSKQGKLWYEVQYGDFTDYEQAKVAKAKLPKDLNNGWIKRT